MEELFLIPSLAHLLRFMGLTMCIAIFLKFFMKPKSRIDALMAKIPGPHRYPLIGSAHVVNVDNEEMATLQFKLVKEYGTRFCLKLGGDYYFVSTRAEDVEKLLSSSVNVEKGVLYQFIRPWIKDGILVSKRQKWRFQRKMLAPALHGKILETFLPILNEQSNTLVQILKAEYQEGEDIQSFIVKFAFDVIAESAMGVRMNAQRQTELPYTKALTELCEIIQYRTVRPWFTWDFVWRLSPRGRRELKCLKIVHDLSAGVVKERKRQRAAASLNKNMSSANNETEPGNSRRKGVAFLDTLLAAQEDPANGMTDEDVQEQVDNLMFGGHDTVAGSINWTIFLLGCHPEHQVFGIIEVHHGKRKKKVQAELDEIFGDEPSSTRDITMDDLSRMEYLELCIKESLRIYPISSIMARILETDLQLDESTLIPKGVNFVMLPLQVHRNPDSYPNPEEFIPERFLPENCATRNPYAFIPFSGGPRNCLGQKFAMIEEKLVLAKILKSFTIQSLERREDIVIMQELVSRPKNGVRVKLIAR